MVAVTPALAVVLVVLVGMAAGALSLARLPLRREVVVASARATVQLALVSVLLVATLRSTPLTLLYLGGMLAAAAGSSARRLRTGLRRPWTALPIVAGTLPVVAVVLASGTIPWRPQSVLPVAGILLGGAMTATVLSGRRMFDELTSRAGEYESALALGFSPRDAALEVARDAAGLALVPGLDQTRTVGLVTLPGAFVGVLLGGGSPAEAGAAQLLVLVGLLAAQGIAVLVTVELVARRRLTTDTLVRLLPV